MADHASADGSEQGGNDGSDNGGEHDLKVLLVMVGSALGTCLAVFCAWSLGTRVRCRRRRLRKPAVPAATPAESSQGEEEGKTKGEERYRKSEIGPFLYTVTDTRYQVHLSCPNPDCPRKRPGPVLSHGAGTMWVLCYDCALVGPYASTKAEAVAAWNRIGFAAEPVQVCEPPADLPAGEARDMWYQTYLRCPNPDCPNSTGPIASRYGDEWRVSCPDCGMVVHAPEPSRQSAIAAWSRIVFADSANA
jgi:hypothetical protein